MATRAFTRNDAPEGIRKAVRYIWTGLTQASADTGVPVNVQGADLTFHVTGTTGVGGLVPVEGSNDGTNFAPLHDAAGNAISLAAGQIATSVESPLWVRPGTTAGDGTTNLTLTLLSRSPA